MSGTNGHATNGSSAGLEREARAILCVILYARVSTQEQVEKGYSLAQQMEALREYAAREGYGVLEEVVDPGQSGASLERPGMDRVRDLVAAGGVSVVLAQDRDRFSREPAYTYLLRREFEEHGTALRALNDRGDDSPEGQLTDGILDQLAKYERAKIAERSRRGKIRKAREGKVIAGRMSRYGDAARYGYRFNEARDHLVVDEDKMSVVRRIFRMVGVEGMPIYAVKRALDAEGVSTATGKGKWAASVIRDIITADLYVPHPYRDVVGLVSPDVAATLEPEESYCLWTWGATRHTRRRVSELTPEGRVYRTRSKVSLKPEEDRIYVPVPSSPASRASGSSRPGRPSRTTARPRTPGVGSGSSRAASCTVGSAAGRCTPTPLRRSPASTGTFTTSARPSTKKGPSFAPRPARARLKSGSNSCGRR